MKNGPLKKWLSSLLSNKIISISTLLILFVLSMAVIKRFDKISGLNYRDVSSWAYREVDENKPVDVFFVCPTIASGNNGEKNMNYNNRDLRRKFVGAINMEKGMYDDVANFYAPYYRQATLAVYSLPAPEQEKYFELAYDDIRDAFKTYMSTMNHGKPVILAGFSQGSDMVIRLMKEFYGDKRYSDNLIAAYCIGWRLTEEEVNDYPWLHPAEKWDDTGSIILFEAEEKGVKNTLVIPEGVKTYSINPLNWKTDDTIAFNSKNLGACFTNYDGDVVKEIPELTGAYIDSDRGSLVVLDINSDEYADSTVGAGSYHVYDYQFFYRNIEKNVRDRSNAFFEKQRLNVRLIEEKNDK